MVISCRREQAHRMMTSCEPRNPRLYAALKSKFGQVKIQNAGAPYEYRVTYEVSSGRKVPKITRFSSGEEYAVCCPFCGDTKYRMSVNHMFGSRLPCGVLLDDQAHCWNEECPDVLPLVRDLMAGAPVNIPATSMSKPISIDMAIEKSSLDHKKLEHVTRLDNMPKDHEVCRYVESRGFDRVTLGRRYGVGYCCDTSPHAKLAYQRMIIPTYYRKTDGRVFCVGWQARIVPGKTNVASRRTPKYWGSPGFMKSFFLYNYPNACGGDWVAVVEGATDAWRFGDNGIALLGKTVSEYQRMQIASAWGSGSGKSGPIVLIADPGFVEDWQKIQVRIQDQLAIDDRHRVVLVTPPKDPGDSTVEELHELIYAACAAAGVTPPIQWASV